MSNLPSSDFFTIGPVTLSYTDQLFEAQSVNQGEPKFGCVCIYDEGVRQQIEQVIESIGRSAFSQEWDIPNKCKRPVRVIQEKPVYVEQIAKLVPGAAYFSNVTSKFAPKVVDAQQKPIIANTIDPVTGVGQVYGGCQAYVSLNVYAYRHPQGGPGVSLGMGAVMVWMRGEALNEMAGVDVAAAFANVPQAPAQPVAQQPQTQQPGAQPWQQPQTQPMAQQPGAQPWQQPQTQPMAQQPGAHPWQQSQTQPMAQQPVAQQPQAQQPVAQQPQAQQPVAQQPQAQQPEAQPWQQQPQQPVAQPQTSPNPEPGQVPPAF